MILCTDASHNLYTQQNYNSCEFLPRIQVNMHTIFEERVWRHSWDITFTIIGHTVVTVALNFDLEPPISNQSKWTLLSKLKHIWAALKISRSKDQERLMGNIAFSLHRDPEKGPIGNPGEMTIRILERIGDFYCNMWSPVPVEVESWNCCQLHLMAVCLNGTHGVFKLLKLFQSSSPLSASILVHSCH